MEEDLRFHIQNDTYYIHVGTIADCKKCTPATAVDHVPETDRDRKIIRDLKKELGK